jgi:hypothetical protein
MVTQVDTELRYGLQIQKNADPTRSVLVSGGGVQARFKQAYDRGTTVELLKSEPGSGTVEVLDGEAFRGDVLENRAYERRAIKETKSEPASYLLRLMDPEALPSSVGCQEIEDRRSRTGDVNTPRDLILHAVVSHGSGRVPLTAFEFSGAARGEVLSGAVDAGRQTRRRS